jgi:hypothetical protein
LGLFHLAWSNCIFGFASLQVTLNIRLQPFRHSWLNNRSRRGRSTTKYCCRSAPLIVSEKQTSQNGTGCVRNSCVSSARQPRRGNKSFRFACESLANSLVVRDPDHFPMRWVARKSCTKGTRQSGPTDHPEEPIDKLCRCNRQRSAMSHCWPV